MEIRSLYGGALVLIMVVTAACGGSSPGTPTHTDGLNELYDGFMCAEHTTLATTATAVAKSTVGPATPPTLPQAECPFGDRVPITPFAP